MSLLKQATGIGGHSGEELKHEGVMDMFKSKNIKTTLRTLIFMDDFSDCEWHQKGLAYLEDAITSEVEPKIHIEDLREAIKINKKFLNSKSTLLVVNKSSKGKDNIKKDLYSEHAFNNVKEYLEKKEYFKWYKKITKDAIDSKLLDKKLSTELNLLKDYLDTLEKVEKELSKENEFTKEEVTVETAINQDWLATKNEIQLLSETASTFTTESASNFISNIKTFFTNSLMGINNALSNFMKTYTITDKYFKDNVNMLNSKSSVINAIISKKFFEIENIETKCVVGMKLNYLGTTKELKIFASKIPEIKTSIDGVSNFIENLYNNHNDARLSNIKNLDNLTELSSKTTEIISELIDGKSIKENVTIGNLFPNSNGIKIVKDELIEVNNILYKADVEALNKSVNRLISVVTIFLKEINENEATYSKGVINSLQYSVKETADIITNFGTFLVLSNQFTSYYLTTIDVIKDNAK